MRPIVSEIFNLMSKRQERNIGILLKFFLALMILVTVYSVVFHFIMLAEHRTFTWITGLYWTLTVMSTLGFGDITFSSDLGKLFSILVLLSGIIFLLTMLPFTFIQFFYLPWLESQTKAKTPRELPEETERHVILTNHDPITTSLIDRLRQHDYQYVIVIQDASKAMELHDLGYSVVVGELGDPETYRCIRVEEAAFVVANVDDMTNTNIAFTIREISKDVPIVAFADLDDSVDILELAGSSHVFQFMKLFGQSLARRVLGASARTNVIGNIDSLLIAEASAMRTGLEGKTIREARLREHVGVTVVGVWERGKFEIPSAQTMIRPTTVLLLAGTAQQLKKYDMRFGHDSENRAPVLILGGGRVGCASAEVLRERNIHYRIIEKDEELIAGEHYVHGSAADIKTLMRAGIQEAPSVIITTRDDPTNIYLTIYCRSLRPDIQIISRANLERSISKLHTAGADLVMSYTSMVSGMILNLLKPDDLLMLAEGLDVFRVETHNSLVGKTLAETEIGRETGCSVIAIDTGSEMVINPDPSFRLEKDNELIMIGTTEAEGRFLEAFAGMGKLQTYKEPGTRQL